MHANGQQQWDDIELVVLADKAHLGFAIMQIIDGQLKLFFGFYNTCPIDLQKSQGITCSFHKHGILWHSLPLPVMIPSSFINPADLSATMVEALSKPPIMFTDAARVNGQMKGLNGQHHVNTSGLLLVEKFRPNVEKAQDKLKQALDSNLKDGVIAQGRAELKVAQSELDEASMWMVEFYNEGM